MNGDEDSEDARCPACGAAWVEDDFPLDPDGSLSLSYDGLPRCMNPKCPRSEGREAEGKEHGGSVLL